MNEDYRRYLSYDNGHGLLIPFLDKDVIDRYSVCYDGMDSIRDLIFQLENILVETDDELLEEVIDHLWEIHYYHETKK